MTGLGRVEQMTVIGIGNVASGLAVILDWARTCKIRENDRNGGVWFGGTIRYANMV